LFPWPAQKSRKPPLKVPQKHHPFIVRRRATNPARRLCPVLPVLGHHAVGGLAHGGAELGTDRGEGRAHEAGNPSRRHTISIMSTTARGSTDVSISAWRSRSISLSKATSSPGQSLPRHTAYCFFHLPQRSKALPASDMGVLTRMPPRVENQPQRDDAEEIRTYRAALWVASKALAKRPLSNTS
jgi:hypothetical protein